MDKPIVWSATWCGPCKALKVWLEANYPDVPIGDVDEGNAPIGIRSVPTLQVGDELIVNSGNIKEWLNKNWEASQ